MSRFATTARRGRWSCALRLLAVALVLMVIDSGPALAVEEVAQIAAQPTSPADYLKAGLEAYRTGDVAVALRFLEKGRDEANPSAELLVALAALYMEQNRLAAAEETALQALELDSTSAAAHVLLGDIYASMGWHQNALQSYTQALTLDPEQAHAWLQKGILLTAEHRYQEAGEALVKARDKLESPTEAFVALGRLRLAPLRHAEAAQFFEFALAQVPEHQIAQQLLVFSLLGAEKPDTAERACREFLARHPDSSELLLYLGEALEQQDRLQEAFAVYGQVLDKNAGSAPAHSRRGRLYCRFKQFEAAAMECRTALSLDPDDALAHAYLGIACAWLGQREEARAHALKAEAAGMRMNTVWEKLKE
jgi:tetratricopeptide (TPR) repeat protein